MLSTQRFKKCMQQSRYWVIICEEKEKGKKGREWKEREGRGEKRRGREGGREGRTEREK